MIWHGLRCLTLLVVALSAIPARAEWFPEIGKSLDTNISAPSSPTEDADCDNYESESAKLLHKLSSAHDECLKDAPPDRNFYKSDGTKITSICSKSSCQNLHKARDELSRNRSNELRECRTTVTELKKTRHISTYTAPAELSSAGDEGTKLARTLLTRFRTPSGTVVLTALDMSRLVQKCQGAKNTTDQKACLRELHVYAKDARRISQPNSVVRKIQDTANEKLLQHQTELIDAMDDIEKNMDSVSKSPSNSQWDDDKW